MRTFVKMLALMLMAGCSSTGTMYATPQNYKTSDLVIDGVLVNISGRTTVKVKKGIISDEHPGPIEIFFDSQRQIYGVLDDDLNGEFAGWSYRGHTTSASCKGDDTIDDNLKLQCIVSIDDVPRVTLQFQLN
jgi:hypothetical protein